MGEARRVGRERTSEESWQNSRLLLLIKLPCCADLLLLLLLLALRCPALHPQPSCQQCQAPCHASHPLTRECGLQPVVVVHHGGHAVKAVAVKPAGAGGEGEGEEETGRWAGTEVVNRK